MGFFTREKPERVSSPLTDAYDRYLSTQVGQGTGDWWDQAMNESDERVMGGMADKGYGANPKQAESIKARERSKLLAQKAMYNQGQVAQAANRPVQFAPASQPSAFANLMGPLAFGAGLGKGPGADVWEWMKKGGKQAWDAGKSAFSGMGGSAVNPVPDTAFWSDASYAPMDTYGGSSFSDLANDIPWDLSGFDMGWWDEMPNPLADTSWIDAFGGW